MQAALSQINTIYTDAQILKQDQLIYNQGQLADVEPYFYIHDRLGSVRLVVDENGAVQNSYTYDPFGQDISAADCAVNIYNPFKFTGQWFDDEISTAHQPPAVRSCLPAEDTTATCNLADSCHRIRLDLQKRVRLGIHFCNDIQYKKLDPVGFVVVLVQQGKPVY